MEVVSNPISGEVGAAARNDAEGRSSLREGFKPHQRGGGCCSPQSINTRHTHDSDSNPISGEVGAAAPLLLGTLPHPKRVSNPISGGVGAAAVEFYHGDQFTWMFQTPSAGRWVLQLSLAFIGTLAVVLFQTPSAGRWVLQQDVIAMNPSSREFQTPSAGRWVLQLGAFLAKQID